MMRTLTSIAKGSGKPDSIIRSSGRIHVLGAGNLGLLFAHSLCQAERPLPITLLLHRKSLLQQWEGSIGVVTGYSKTGREKMEIASCDVELISDSERGIEEDIIDSLILTTKTLNTVGALSTVKHRLDNKSTILFAQNGMGTIEEVNDIVFPDASSRPNYLTSVVSHGVYGTAPFRIVHAGLGTISIVKVEEQNRADTESQYLIEQVVNAPALMARQVNLREFRRLQLQKLVVNSMINPLTVVFDCRNDALFSRPPILSLMRRLLVEASRVICSLPELKDDPSREEHFSEEALEKVVLDIAITTGKNTSSMLQDVRLGKATEIDYINGYLVRRGEELGIPCGVNRKLVEMVTGVRRISPDEIQTHFP